MVRLLPGLALAAIPGSAIAAPKARLVHCGAATCLRISDRRAHSEVEIRLAGHRLQVEGDRAWRATVPLEMARDWASVRGGTLTLTLIDAHTGRERTQVVTPPPGALGKRVELASMTISAH